MPRYEFNENNSGGSWWLNRRHYEALFAAGWKYEKPDYESVVPLDEPWLGRKDDDTPYGWRHNTVGDFASMKEAVESWESATGMDFFAEGCNCCGAPFSMSTEDPYEYLSGDDVQRNAVRPF